MHPTRWYQNEALDALWTNLQEKPGSNPLVCLPTGSGKSLVIAQFLLAMVTYFPGMRIIVSTHVKELIEQNYAEFTDEWINAPAGIFSAAVGRREHFYPITFCGIGTLANAVKIFGHVDIFIIDEAQLLGPSADGQYMRTIMALKAVNPNMRVVGLTATAWRTGMGMLTNGEIFTDIAYDICNISGFKRLFSEGYLVPPHAKKTDNIIDTSGVRINNGEYSQSGLQEVTKSAEITWKALNESLNKNPDRTCRLVFCTGVEHAILSAEMLRYIGLRAEVVHSGMSKGARNDVINAYRNGELDALTNNGICTTGLNVRQIDHIIGLRPTLSVGLHVQMIGRGMRPWEYYPGSWKQNCIVSDHAGNVRNLGPIDDPYIPKMKGKGGGDMPVKLCLACGGYNHAAARVCEQCGEPFEIKVGFKAKAFDDQIVRSDVPIIETYNVDSVYYTQHIKKNALITDKPTLKAVYKCGWSHEFKEFIPIEHAGINKRARDWWRRRFMGADYMPATVAEALQHVDKLAPPKAIKVHVNTKYPSIVDYEY